MADALKLMGKELITPEEADKPVFWLAPIIVLLVLLSFLVIPFSQTMIIKDMNVGIILILGFSTLAVLAILMAGWSSNNKYSVLGAIRSVAQNVAYEIPLLITVMSIILMVGCFKLRTWWRPRAACGSSLCSPWPFSFLLPAPPRRQPGPFDLPEAESELVAGFHTEYSGMRFAVFFLAEYTNMFIAASGGTGLFWGRWHGPFLPGVVWFLVKVYALIFMIMWFRWTFPRVGSTSWSPLPGKYLIPLAFANLLITALVLKLR